MSDENTTDTTTAEQAAEQAKISRSKVPAEYRQKYGKAGNCGDEMAGAIAAFLAPAGGDKTKVRALLVELGDANGISVEARWGARNNGMVRMNLGNVLRGMLARPEKRIVVGSWVRESAPVAAPVAVAA